MSEPNHPYFAADPAVPIVNPAAHSFSYIIRDGILARMKTRPTFQSVKKFARNKMQGQVQKENLPYFGCFLLRDRFGPDGDTNAGAPHFMHRTDIGFSVMISCDDVDVAENNLDLAHWSIMTYLTRQDWWHFKMPEGSPFPEVQIESIEGGEWKPNYGREVNHETPWAEMAMQVYIKYRTIFEPEVLDRFEKMHVTVAPKWPYDPGAYDPPFVAEYDLPQD